MQCRWGIVTLILSLLMAPLAAHAQPAAKVYQVGLLGLGSGPTWWHSWLPFLEAMRELHYIEGRNLVLQPAFADGQVERLPALAAELVQAQVDVIVTTGARETVAAKQATSMIPIVMLLVPDPVAQELVVSLARSVLIKAAVYWLWSIPFTRLTRPRAAYGSSPPGEPPPRKRDSIRRGRNETRI